jgi:thymidylate synthase (FAD)
MSKEDRNNSDSSERPQEGRPISSGLERLLGTSIPVLTGGFVRPVDYMGSDASVVQAARVSYGQGTRTVHEDRGLIRYLMRHHHTTPFEMCEIKLHVRVPMDTWRQWIRHRTASVNEYSTRYSIAIDEALATQPNEWRLQTNKNKQGSHGFLDSDSGQTLTDEEAQLLKAARSAYERRLSFGVAREQARKDLPLSTFTEAYWKIDLWNLLHFLDLRMRGDAQEEIRRYATTIGQAIVAEWVPLCWEAFLDYRLRAVQLSALEADLLKVILARDDPRVREIFESLGWLEKDATTGKVKKHRERDEFISKMRKQFGVSVGLFDQIEVMK